MATSKLFLKEPKAPKITRVIGVLTDGRGVQIKIPSDISVNPKHWGKNQKVRSANSNAVEINKQLEVFRNAVLNIYLEAKAAGLKVNAEYIREKLKPKKEAVSANAEFWNVWEYFLQYKRSSYKKKSFEKFQALKNHLKQFEAEVKIPLQLKTLTAETLNKLQDYFYNKAGRDKTGLNTQTTAKYIELFKSFLNWAVNHKYSDDTSFKSFTPIQQPDNLKVILTAEDIGKIKKANFGVKGYLNNVRELLILSTLTGLRYSDSSRIKAEHIKKDEGGAPMLHIRQEKTDEYVDIPLTLEANTIINRLISGEVHPISNQKMNKYVKELCKIAEVDEPFEIHKYKGKMRVTQICPKYELISTHTGRRTFATNLLLKGIPAQTVMKFTGHRDYKSFSKYVNIPKKAEMEMVKQALLG